MFQERRSEYAQMKVFHHGERMRALAEGRFEDIVPVTVQLDLTNICPHQCFYCYQYIYQDLGLNWALHEPTQITKHERAKELLGEMGAAGVKGVEFVGRGEPLSYPKVDEILRTSRDAGLEIGIITSASVLRDSTLDALAYATPTWMRWSFDSLTDETFDRIRKPKSRAVGRRVVFENIRRLCERLSAEKAATRLSASTVVLPENFREVKELARFTKGLGMKSHVFRLVNFKDRDKIYEPVWGEMRAALEDAQAELEDEHFAVHLPPPHFYEKARKPYPRCYFTLFDVAIDVGFNVYACIETIYDPKYLIGNVGEPGSFRELLRHPRRRTVMEQVASCPACCRDEANELLAGFAEAMHTSFL